MKDSIFFDKEVTANITFRVNNKSRENVSENINHLPWLEDKLTEFEPEADLVAWVLEESLYNIEEVSKIGDLTLYTCTYEGVWSSRQYSTLDFLEENGVRSKFVITTDG